MTWVDDYLSWLSQAHNMEYEEYMGNTKTWKEQEVWCMTMDEKVYATVNRTDTLVGLLTIRELVNIDEENQKIGEILYQESVSLPRTGLHATNVDGAQWTDMVAKYLDERSITVAPRQGG